MRRKLLAFLFTVPLAVLGPGVAGLARAQAPPLVIVLSWDGTRHDYPERADTPALDRMQQDGARGTLVPVFPSSTFPNHVSLATGAHADRHGIVGNRFTDRERGAFSYSNDASWIEAEPVWITAERQGVRAATFFWVGSETDWQGRGASLRVAPFDDSVPESAKVDRILAWLDLPAAERPGLILSWWRGCDRVGHQRGPAHPAIARQLAAQDRDLGRLLAALDARNLWSTTTLLVVSDHGMTEARHALDPEETLRRAGVSARVDRGGGVAWIGLRSAEQREPALEVLRALDHVRAWPSDALPPELRAYHPRRSGDIALLADPPVVFYRVGFWPRVLAPVLRLFGKRRGAHGYDPGHPDMTAIFYALGRGVPAAARPGKVRAIDVAPTVTELLGIEPPAQSEGRPIFDVSGP